MKPAFLLGVALLVACAAPPAVQTSRLRPYVLEQSMVLAQKRPGTPWEPYPTRSFDRTALASQPVDATNAFGGSLAWPAEAATGFFRTALLDGRWWLIDPEGRRFIHAGVVGVTRGSTRSATNQAALAARFGGSHERWARHTAQWLRDNGFNGVGAWSDTAWLTRPELATPHARIVNFMSDYGKQRGGTYQKPGHTGYPNDAIFVFDPAFANFAESYAQRLKTEAANPWLIGWFSDNEMPLDARALDKFLALPEGDAGLQEARRWLAARQGRSAHDARRITEDDRLAWAGHVFETYARIVSTAIRRADPNHLYLGSRFHGGELTNPYVFRAAGRYLDVIAINYYRVWSPQPEQVRNWSVWSGKPVMITEWYTKGEDSGLPNTTGAGWAVRTQADRGRFYQNFALGLLESRTVVGWHWFKYMDNDPADPDAEPSNRDANKGLVKLDFTPHAPLLDAAREFNLRKYAVLGVVDGARR